MQAFDYFLIIQQKYVKWDIENSGYYDISCLKTLIALVVYLIVTFAKFRNSKFDLNDSLVNN